MHVVLTALPGVAPYLAAEVARTDGLASLVPAAPEPDATELGLEVAPAPESLAALSGLRTAVAAFLTLDSPAPRPTGLLASETLVQFDAALELIARQRPRVRFTGLRVDAAGSDSPQLQRLAAVYAERAGVDVADDGDLHLRVRRTPGGQPGWQVLVRTTPRPLATRAWRTERYPGALNATIAAAVVDELGVDDSDRFADLMCGSGTLVIERMARGRAERMVAVDRDPGAVEIVGRHLRAARLPGRVDRICADVDALGRPDAGEIEPGSLNRIVANPPWGELLGEHADNETLYAQLLDAVDRVGSAHVRAGILTHDIRRFETLLASDGRWRVVARPQFFAKGHRPRLFVLERAS